MIYSFSSLSMYEDCPYSYYLKYKLKLIGETNAHAEIGSYAHDLLSKIVTEQMTVDEALNDCVENFDNYVTAPISEKTKSNKYIALCEYLSDLDEHLLDKYQVLMAEDKLVWTMCGRNMIGVIDLLLKDKETGENILVDHKSSKHFLKANGTPLKAQEENLNRYKKQMYLYAYGIQKKIGLKVDKIVWNHFLDGGQLTVLPFVEDDMTATVEWALDVINKIENDKTFEPKMSYAKCKMLCDYRNGDCEYLEDDDYAELS